MFKLVNPKQFARILKRREKLKSRKKPKVESRSLLANGRKRSNGRFLSIQEIETLKKLDRFENNEILPPTGLETEEDKEILERVEKELLCKKPKIQKDPDQSEEEDGEGERVDGDGGGEAEQNLNIQA
jgi:hypothetical protein